LLQSVNRPKEETLNHARAGIRPLDSPDHGLGPLGQFAHAVTAGYLDEPPASPGIFIGHNTMPDPPYPMPARAEHFDTAEAWRTCGGDLYFFLESGLSALRAQPVPQASDFEEEIRRLQYLLRIDSMALAWRALSIDPASSVASWTLAADLFAGRATREDLTPDVATPTLATWAVDRAGTALLAVAPFGGTEDDITVEEAPDPAPDRVPHLLSDILSQQYSWTMTVFGSQPPPGLEQAADALRHLGSPGREK
jgi:hypothetical protein